MGAGEVELEAVGPHVIQRLNAGLDQFLEQNADKGWKTVEDFRGLRRDRVKLQSEIRRPDASEYEGGYEHVEGYAAPTEAAVGSRL